MRPTLKDGEWYMIRRVYGTIYRTYALYSIGQAQDGNLVPWLSNSVIDEKFMSQLSEDEFSYVEIDPEAFFKKENT